jgi:hypothetical protein
MAQVDCPSAGLRSGPSPKFTYCPRKGPHLFGLHKQTFVDSGRCCGYESSRAAPLIGRVGAGLLVHASEFDSLGKLLRILCETKVG